jgi:hypothetical protein
MIVGSTSVRDRKEPERRPNSVRRTLTVDASRPAGFAGPVEVHAVGQDHFYDGHRSQELGSVALDVVVGPEPGHLITSVVSSPEVPALDALVGSSGRQGLRRGLSGLEVAPGSGTLALRLLDDLPAVTTLSRLTIIHEGDVPYGQLTGLPLQAEGRVGVCAGWAAGSSMNALVEAGLSPVHDHDDVVAPDMPGEYPSPPPRPGRFRRFRQLDVARAGLPGPGDGPELVEVRSMFRDTYVDAEGIERVEHEYRLSARVDVRTGVIVESAADPLVLPALECPRAAASAGWLTGSNVADSAPTRRMLVGPSTCTHLTQALLAYSDVPELVRGLETIVGGPE